MSDFVTYIPPEKIRRPAAAIASRSNGTAKKNRTNPPMTMGEWMDATAALLDRHSLELDVWGRKLATALVHLKATQEKLNAAEEQILSHENRIAALEDLATCDELTGLKNRRGFYEGFVRELESCQRGFSKGGLLIMIDLDDFKGVNDTYGHLAGDAALKLVGKTLETEIRKTDIAARLGGDEFVLLLADTNKTAASGRAQMIAHHLNNLSLAWYGDIIPIKASIGLQSFSGGDTVESIISGADGTLYTNKFERKASGARMEQGGAFSKVL